MDIAVVGLWHLGTVYASCLAAIGHTVIGVDVDTAVVEALVDGRLPVAEPGLEDLEGEQRTSGRLNYSSRLSDVRGKDLVWICVDTPVDDEDVADVAYVEEIVLRCAREMSDGDIFVISSQLPLGTVSSLQHKLEMIGRNIAIVSSPENLRLGSAIEVFMRPDRVIVGGDDERSRARVVECLEPLQATVIEMSAKSAELTKHAINGFLATSVVYGNEIGRIAEAFGADPMEVYRGLSSDARIGERAYVRPGGPIAGGTLLRDVGYLTDLASEAGVEASAIGCVGRANASLKRWGIEASLRLAKSCTEPVLVVGLAYKTGTNTLRRSFGLEVLDALMAAGLSARAYDSRVLRLPDPYSSVTIEGLESLSVTRPPCVIVCADDPTLPNLWEMITEVEEEIQFLDLSGAVSHRGLTIPPHVKPRLGRD